MLGMKLFEEECCDYYGLLDMSGTKLFGGRMSSLWAMAMSSGMKLFHVMKMCYWICQVQNCLRKNVSEYGLLEMLGTKLMNMGYLSAEMSTEKQETACGLRKSMWARAS
jgi:hypothetical protein